MAMNLDDLINAMNIKFKDNNIQKLNFLYACKEYIRDTIGKTVITEYKLQGVPRDSYKRILATHFNSASMNITNNMLTIIDNEIKKLIK